MGNSDKTNFNIARFCFQFRKTRTAEKETIKMNTILRALCAACLLLGFAAQASAQTAYKVCVRVPDVSDSGTDDDLYAKLYGNSGETRLIHLDNKGVDDNNRNTRSCFDLSNVSHAGKIDSVRLLLKGNDDVCINDLHVYHYVNGGLRSQFQVKRHFCLGNDSQSQAVRLWAGSVQFQKSNGTPIKPKATTSGGFVGIPNCEEVMFMGGRTMMCY